jgi:hypothetical protein
LAALTAYAIRGDNAAMATNTTNTAKRPKSKGRTQPIGIKRDRVNIWITRKCADDLAQLMAQLTINQRGATQLVVLEALVENELRNQREYAQQVAVALMKASARSKFGNS